MNVLGRLAKAEGRVNLGKRAQKARRHLYKELKSSVLERPREGVLEAGGVETRRSQARIGET